MVRGTFGGEIRSTDDEPGEIDAWMIAAWDAVKWCAVHYELFTTNEVWDRLRLGRTTTQENGSLGAVMTNAARHGLIRNTGRFRRSRVPHHHGRPVTVWRSLIPNDP